MGLYTGFLFVFIAGILQGTFLLPMTFTRKWAWEHTWAAFSLLGMFCFNWVIALLIIPDIGATYGSFPGSYLTVLIAFGAAWGCGAILFGLGMDRLGMALGYPIIMGLIASLGGLIPLLVFFPGTLLTTRGLALLVGTGIAILGIVLCAIAGARKQALAGSRTEAKSINFRVGLVIAILAGILSCFPNIGLAFVTNVIAAAHRPGTSKPFSSNAIWALFFGVGFLINFAYCVYLMSKHKNLKDFMRPETARNMGLTSLMAIMWIGSFYLYGMGAVKMGKWGVVVGWPLFISLSIGVGNLWGIWRGEWKGAAPSARLLLSGGLFLLLLAVFVIGSSNLV
jgi:L-rhamnose-H+ transport protein